MMNKKNLTSYEFLFKNLAEDIEFNIIGGGYKSKEYVIDVIPSPAINSVKTVITPPLYTNRKKETQYDKIAGSWSSTPSTPNTALSPSFQHTE